MTDSQFEDMLIRAVQAVEQHNLSELLPLDVFHWWEARKAEELAEQEREKSEALKFCERQLEHWRKQQQAASREGK